MVPKTPIGCVDLRDVAEELLGINFTKYDIVLKIAQTVEEQLKEERLTTIGTENCQLQLTSWITFSVRM